MVKSLSLPEELWDRLDSQAAAERRTRSNMAAAILEAGLVDVRPLPVVPKFAATAPESPAASTGPRTTVCPHRVPPAAYCTRCGS